ncbi:MAG: hydrogenase iron-sulfur subunit [Desulfarculaceae bacterium]|jgi:coenzyme F420-reducing hydrogenase delta subunit/NAD-dependent dihydropyrimidine dehydrogenase PreA subunit
MPEVALIWVDAPGLEGLQPEDLAQAAGLSLDQGGTLEAAVACVSQAAAPPSLRRRLAGKPVKWLDLVAEIGGGDAAHRRGRALLALARSAGQAALGTLPQVYTAKPALNLLVAGAGVAALAVAKEAVALGHPVLLATPFAELDDCGPDEDKELVARLAKELPVGLDTARQSELIYLSGAAGDFLAVLKGPRGEQEFRCGAVALAPPGAYLPQEGQGRLDQEWVQPLSALDPAAVQGQNGQWLYAAVLADLGSPASAPDFDRAVRAALALQQRPRVQAVLIFSEARVASEGGERRFRQARDAGVLCVRPEPGELEIQDGGRRLYWRDRLLDEEIELEPGLLAVADTAAAPRPGFLGNQVLWPSWDWLVPEGPRYSGGRTSRSGLYLLGALRGTPPGLERLSQAAAVAADLHDRLSGSLAGGPAPLPAVSHDYCASCLTCVRVCPHGAPRFASEHIEAAPAACVACGVCAAECPAEAIAPPGWSNPEMEAGLKRGLEAADGPALVLFACSQSALPALAGLSRQGHQWPAGLLVFPVACAGRVGQQLILKALTLGAGGVLVAGCHEGNCRSVQGNLRARLRTREIRDLLEQIGSNPERVEFLNMASNQPRALARAVDEMTRRIDKNGR